MPIDLLKYNNYTNGLTIQKNYPAKLSSDLKIPARSVNRAENCQEKLM